MNILTNWTQSINQHRVYITIDGQFLTTSEVRKHKIA